MKPTINLYLAVCALALVLKFTFKIVSTLSKKNSTDRPHVPAADHMHQMEHERGDYIKYIILWIIALVTLFVVRLHP